MSPTPTFARLLLPWVVVAVSTISAPVHGQILLPGTQPGDIVHWQLLGPDSCKSCHWNYDSGPDYEPYDTWAGSMMANSARDPLFWAAVDIANQDVPGAGEFCIRCHSPRAWLSGRSSSPDGSALLGYPDEPDNDFEGIDCHFCHRMYEGPTATPFLENGQYWVDDGTATNEPPRRGPYSSTFAPHPAARSDYHDSSEFCAVCHDLRNPLVNLLDANGVDTGRLFPEQITYTEWLQSDFATEGTDCQDCHMPPAEQSPAFACNSFNPPRPNLAQGDSIPVYRHDLAGANTFIPRVLKGLYGEALGRTEAYDYTLARAFEMLQERSATVEVTTPVDVVAGEDLSLNVRVTNLTGHKLPTGYPEGRRMWLEVIATDALGIPFFASGSYDTTSATLDADAQLRSYEVKHGIHGQGESFHLVLNDRIMTDTRIPPRGFRPDTDTQPIGRSYELLPDGSLAHWDEAPYTIPVPTDVQGPVRVIATLRYQTSSREYIEFLRDENVSGSDPHDRNHPNAPSRGDKIHQYWSAFGKSAPVDMVRRLAVVPVKIAPPSVASLTATPGHNQVRLNWSPPAGTAMGAKILRTTWGDYPEFGSAGSALPAPTIFPHLDDALSSGWVEVYDGPATEFIDTAFDDSSRDMALYAAYAYDAEGTFAPALTSSRTTATTYRLGDFGEIGVPGVYDGLIDGVNDLPLFSLAYGSRQGDPGWNAEADIAPTDDGSSEGIPMPDDVVDFQDLVVFSLQFGSVPSTETAPRERLGPAEALTLRVAVEPDGSWNVLAENGGEQLHALELRLHSDSSARAVGVDVGSAWRQARAPFFATTSEDDGSSAVFALLGRARVLGQGSDLGRIRFADGIPRPHEATWTAIDGEGRPMETTVRWDGRLPVPVPRAALELSQNHPNPFNPRTTFEMRVERSGPVEVTVYDASGRRVATLIRGILEAGTHPIVFDGTDHRGHDVASGVYLIRASGHGITVTRRMTLIR